MYKSLNASQRDVFWVLLHLANHDYSEWKWKGELCRCKPGQLITSLANIRELCAADTTPQKIRTALMKLEEWQFIANESTKVGRLITIVNWKIYQLSMSDSSNELTKELTKEQAKINKGTNKAENGENINYNIHLNDVEFPDQQSYQQSQAPKSTKELTSNKKYKEIKKNKEEEYCPEPSQKKAPVPEPQSTLKPFFCIPLKGPSENGNEFPITDEIVSDYRKTFLGLDIMQSLRECRQWNVDNPTRRKTASGIRKHITGWLTRDNNKGTHIEKGGDIDDVFRRVRDQLKTNG